MGSVLGSETPCGCEQVIGRALRIWREAEGPGRPEVG